MAPQEWISAGVPSSFDDEGAGEMLHKWTSHVPSKVERPDPRFYERLNKTVVVPNAIHSATHRQHQQEGRSSAAPSQRSSAASKSGRRPQGQIAGASCRPHSPFTEVMINRLGAEAEHEMALKKASLARERELQQQPLKFKLTKSTRHKLKVASNERNKCEEPIAEPWETNEWTMSKFKNVQSHFERDRTAFTQSASAPSLSRSQRATRAASVVKAAPVLKWAQRTGQIKSNATDGLNICGTAAGSDISTQLPDGGATSSISCVSAATGLSLQSSNVRHSVVSVGGRSAGSNGARQSRSIPASGSSAKLRPGTAPAPRTSSEGSLLEPWHPLGHRCANAYEDWGPQAEVTGSASLGSKVSVPRSRSAGHERPSAVSEPVRPKAASRKTAGSTRDSLFVSEMWSRHRPSAATAYPGRSSRASQRPMTAPVR